MKSAMIRNLVLTALFFALGLVLPFLTGQVPEIGNMLLPMHLPVFLCALICGWKYATPMAFVLPLIRSLFFGMPPIYPTAVAMAFELAAYAFVAGFIYFLFKKQSVEKVYVSIIASMVAGRIVWGSVQLVLLGIGGNPFTWEAFWAGAVLKAIPGIVMLLIVVPAVMLTLDSQKLIRFRRG